MTKEKIRHPSWWQAGLVMLPGLTYLLVLQVSRYPVNTNWGLVAIVLVVLLFAPAVAGIWLAIRGRSLSAFPAWGVPALGLLLPSFSLNTTYLSGAPWAALLVILAALLFVLWRHGLRRIPATVWGLIVLGAMLFFLQETLGGGFHFDRFSLGMPALLVAVGILLAPRHGPLAGFVVLPLSLLMTVFETGHMAYFGESSLARGESLSYIVLILFSISPVIALRVHSVAGRSLALLSPVASYYLLLAIWLAQFSLVRDEGPAGVLSRAEPVMQLLLLLVGLCALYGWLWEGRHGGEDGERQTEIHRDWEGDTEEVEERSPVTLSSTRV